MSEVNQKTLGRVLQVEGAADTEDSMFPMRGSQVPSLVGEPRFHMLFSTPEEREMGCSLSSCIIVEEMEKKYTTG